MRQPPPSPFATSLVALTVACTLSAVIFGFGVAVFSVRLSYADELGRLELALFTRLLVLIVLGVLLALRGDGWRGVLAALAMVFATTAIEWLLLPVAFSLGESFGIPEGADPMPGRPGYLAWSLPDLFAVGMCAVIARIARTLAGASE